MPDATATPGGPPRPASSRLSQDVAAATVALIANGRRMLMEGSPDVTTEIATTVTATMHTLRRQHPHESVRTIYAYLVAYLAGAAAHYAVNGPDRSGEGVNDGPAPR